MAPAFVIPVQSASVLGWRLAGCAESASARASGPASPARVAVRSRPRWTCETKAHPWGNGGLNNVANWDGYKREDTIAELAELRAEFEKGAATREASHRSMWALIFNTDLIQWHNNLLDASYRFGLPVNLNSARVVKVVEEIARTAFDGPVDALWTLRRGDVEPGSDMQLVSASSKAFGKMLITFEKQDDAVRFAANMTGDGRGNIVAERLPIEEIKACCSANDMLIGFIPPCFVQPSHFAPGMVSEGP
jgi:hypothetical protein